MFLLQTFLFFVLSLLYSAYCLPVALWLFMVNCTLLRFHQQTLLVLGLMKLVFGEIFVWQEHLTVLLKSFVFFNLSDDAFLYEIVFLCPNESL